LYVRGKQNVQKRLLLQAAAGNLAVFLRKDDRRGKSVRAMQDAVAHPLLVFLRLISAMKRPE
jgi:hypothetical protein